MAPRHLVEQRRQPARRDWRLLAGGRPVQKQVSTVTTTPTPTSSRNAHAHSGTGIAIGTPVRAAITGVHDNTLEDVINDFNLENIDQVRIRRTSTPMPPTISQITPVRSTVNRLHVSRHPRRRYLDRRGRVDVLEGGAGNDALQPAAPATTR